jgi:hypothetical protein
MKTPHRLVKRAIDGCCLAMVSPLAGLCALESRYGGGDACFTFAAQLCALLPGLPGVFLRRAFYRLTLESCGRSFFIGFGAMFSHRTARVADDVYVGPWAMIGACDLGQGCLIVRFAARNSLIVFLAHMPIYFALQPLLARSGLSYWSRVTVLLVVCGPVLACVSEAIQKMAPPDRLRAALLSFGSGPIDIEGLRLLRRRLTP